MADDDDAEVSSCNEAEEEARMPEVNESNLLRFISIKQVEEVSNQLVSKSS